MLGRIPAADLAVNFFVVGLKVAIALDALENEFGYTRNFCTPQPSTCIF
ncbi:MAG: hypothetical protein KME12_13045 [Trichocoleus desertorum ATA4-8-CV12]|nr:hypothetical protein [Trichocoleus desertorum ATA4-8-CV12]